MIKNKIIPLIENRLISTSLDYLLELLYLSKQNYHQQIPGKEAGTIVFAHHDPDGICCTSLFERFFKDKDSKFFYIGQEHTNLIQHVKPGKKLFVFDLILNENLAKHMMELNQNGIEAEWIDHHRRSLDIPSELLNYLKNNGILIYQNTKSAASLYYNYSRFSDKIAERICLIADRCSGDKSKRTAEVSEDSILLGKLSNLDRSIFDDLRKELAKYGEIKSEKFREEAKVCDLLVAHGKRIMRKNLFYDGENFQVYSVNPLLIMPKRIMSLISSENKKDVYLIEENADETILYGFSRLAKEIFPRLAVELGGTIYWRRHFCRCTFFNKDIKEILEGLEKLYEKS
jgi:hypothetical protein